MSNILETFASFREQTSDDTAAALLTLAAVIRGEQADETPLTVKQAAKRLGNVSPDVVYDLCASGKLECQRIGKGRGTIRISPAALASIGKPRIFKLRDL